MISTQRVTRKIQLKVDRGGELMWVHLCYVNPDISDVFFAVTKTKQRHMVKWVRVWAEEDFNWDIDFTEYSHIKLLKELVLNKYKRIYPHLYYNNAVDTHGWMRCWISEKMGKEIRKHDKPAYNRLFNSTPNYSGRL